MDVGLARCGPADVGLGGVRVMRWCPSLVRPGVARCGPADVGLDGVRVMRWSPVRFGPAWSGGCGAGALEGDALVPQFGLAAAEPPPLARRRWPPRSRRRHRSGSPPLPRRRWPPPPLARRRGCGLDGLEAASCRRAEHCVDDSHVGDGIE